MSPYEIQPATDSFLYTPISLNKSFFGSPNSTISWPGKPENEPNMAQIGCGRGILGKISPTAVLLISDPSKLF